MRRSSLWMDTVKIKDYPILNKDINAQVLVIGGGLTGLLTAYLIKERGGNPVVIDAGKIASGTSGRTTAKITCQHRLIYSYITEKISTEMAQMYATANIAAIESYRKLIKDKNILCDFKDTNAYVYTTEDKYLEDIYREVELACKYGINADFTTDTELPFLVKGAVRFSSQAEFNPCKFMEFIAKDLVIYEHTTAHTLEENIVITNRGKIYAENIVMACHFPFVNFPGFYFARMHQERSYLIALKNADTMENMYIDVNESGNTFRGYGNIVLMGGENHQTGKNHVYECYNNLLYKSKELFKNSEAVLGWSSQDCMSLDKIPYIGRFTADSPNIYVATGYNKWGMSTSMVAADIISKMILSTPPSYAEVFSPQRFNPSASVIELAKNSAQATTAFLAQLVGIPSSTTDSLPLGHGGIVEYDNHKAGVYKDNDGNIYVVSTKCPHLGCQLEWNPEEKSWDCPCHGSRFDYKGMVLNSPATHCLDKLDV